MRCQPTNMKSRIILALQAPIIPALKNWKQRNGLGQASLGYSVNLCLDNNKRKPGSAGRLWSPGRLRQAEVIGNLRSVPATVRDQVSRFKEPGNIAWSSTCLAPTEPWVGFPAPHRLNVTAYTHNPSTWEMGQKD